MDTTLVTTLVNTFQFFVAWTVFMMIGDAFVLYLLHKTLKVIHMQSYK